MTPLNTIDYPYKVHEDTYTTGGRCFVAEHPDLPGCVGYGDTREDALDRLAESRQAYLASMRAAGRDLPKPSVQTIIFGGADLFSQTEAPNAAFTEDAFSTSTR